MQTVSPSFAQQAKDAVQHIAQRVLISFPKEWDPDVGFFTLDESILDGSDILQGTGDVVQEWDKFLYQDYSDRVLSVEWEHYQDLPFSTVQAMADITLDNSDDYFTPGAGSEIDGYILPRRPIRIFAGYGHETIPVFIGLTDEMPVFDDEEKTVSFHCIDFLSWIFDRKIRESVMLAGARIDEILDHLLQLVGLEPPQYQLDVAVARIKYAYFEKDTKLGEAVKKLMQAEMGTMLMDENGIIRFLNRGNKDETIVYDFDDEVNIIDKKSRDQSEIINRVEIQLEARDIAPPDIIYRLSEPLLLPANQTRDHWIEFQDPMVTSEDPEFLVNQLSTGEGEDFTGNVSLVDYAAFTKSAKITLNNSGPRAYVTELTIQGEAAIIRAGEFVEEQDDVSVEKYEEQIFTIDGNPFIQDYNTGQALALTIVSSYSEFGVPEEIEVVGSPALQVNDQVSVTADEVYTEHAICRVRGAIEDGDFRQLLQLRDRPPFDYFILDESMLDGEDVLGA